MKEIYIIILLSLLFRVLTEEATEVAGVCVYWIRRPSLLPIDAQNLAAEAKKRSRHP